MKNLKRIFLSMIMLVALTVLFFALDTSAYAATYGKLTYSVSSGEVIITDCSATVTEIEIPANINGYPVTSIGDNAFYYCSSLTTVTIPDSVTSIGDYAFYYCSSLTNITISDNIASIGDYTFLYCSSLTSIYIPDSVITIGNGAFCDCSKLTDIYYSGTESEWNKITIGYSNYDIQTADVHFEHEHSFSESVEVIPSEGYGTCSVTNIKTYTCSVCNFTYSEIVELNEDTHTWGEFEVIEAATCEEDGYMAKKCSVCGAESFRRIVLSSSTYPESNHEYSNNMNREYTFSYPGASKLYLTFSSYTEFESNYDYLYIYDADGTQIGRYSSTSLAGRTITINGDSFKLKLFTDGSVTRYGFSFTRIEAEYCGDYEIIPATGHNYTDEITIPATCSQEGVKTFTCSNCNDTYTESIGIDPTAHNINEWETIKEATFDSNGYKVKKCSRCGYFATEQITLPTDTYPESYHNYGNYLNETYTFSYQGAKTLYLTFSYATEFESSYDYLYIYDADGTLIGSYSGTSLAGRTITINGDSFKLKLVTDISVTQYGFSFTKIEAECFEDYEIIPSLGHNYTDEITTPATCYTTGIRTYTCSVCGHTYTETIAIDSTNHEGDTEIRDTVAANCGTTGYTGNTYCLGCNTKIADGSVISATGNHNYSSEITTPSTCSAEGVITYTCSVCNYSYNEAVEIDENAHTWGEFEVIEAATCEEDGYKAKRCTACGVESFGSIILPSFTYPESNHEYSNNMNREYTFSYPGASKLYLTFSSYTEFESGFDYLYIYDADGTLIGSYSSTSLAGRTITINGDSFKLRLETDGSATRYGFSFTRIEAEGNGNYEVIPATGHNYTDEITTPATCSQEGVKTFTCSNCNDTYTESIGIDPTAHNINEWETIKEATFDTDGYKVKKCSICGYFDTIQITLPNDTYPESYHNYGNYLNETYTFSYEGAKNLYLTFSYATEFEYAYDYLYIYNSAGEEIGRYTGTSLAGNTIIIAGDSFSLRLVSDSSYSYYGFSFISIEADVADPDSENYEVIPAMHNHDYVSEITKEATCSAEGEITYTCSFCGYSYTEIIEIDSANHVGNTEIRDVKYATCTANGYSGDTYCTGCNTVIFTGNKTDKLAHTEITVKGTAPTCTESGLTDGTKCSVCGTVIKTQERISATGHDYVSVSTKPSCTQPGRTTYTCDCGYTYTVNNISALGHSFGDWTVVIAATITTEGTKIRVCSVCNEKETQSIDKLLFVPGDANGDNKITAADARMVLRISANIDKAENYNIPLEVIDVTGDSKITASDARKILRISAGLEKA